MRAVLLQAVAAAALQPNEVWQSIKQQASVAANSKPMAALLRPYLNEAIGAYGSLAPATAALLTERLGGANIFKVTRSQELSADHADKPHP